MWFSAPNRIVTQIGGTMKILSYILQVVVKMHCVFCPKTISNTWYVKKKNRLVYCKLLQPGKQLLSLFKIRSFLPLCSEIISNFNFVDFQAKRFVTLLGVRNNSF